MTLKQLRAVFIGGCFGMLVVFFVSRWLWPLGAFIGGFVAYIGYDFRKWWTAFRNQVHDGCVELRYRLDLVKEWFQKPHPFWLTYVLVIAGLVFFIPVQALIEPKHGLVGAYMMKGILIVLGSALLQAFFSIIAERGAVDKKYGFKQYWEGEWFVEREDMPSDKAFDIYFSHLPSQCEKVPATYGNIYRMFLWGLVVMVLRAPFYASAIAMTFIIPIMKVHTRTRLMCGVYAGLGIVVTYIAASLVRNLYELSPTEKGIVIMTAGVAGSCIGLACSHLAVLLLPKLDEKVEATP